MRVEQVRKRNLKMSGLASFLTSFSPHPKVDHWGATFLKEDGSAATSELLVAMTQTIQLTFKHMARHEKASRHRPSTSAVGVVATMRLMIAALR
jgi:hypothetical protein